MLEVFTHLAEQCGESICKQIQGLPNWVNRHAPLLPWPDEEISHVLFDIPVDNLDDLFARVTQEIVQKCQSGLLVDVLQDACEFRDTTQGYKTKYAAGFQSLMNIYSNESHDDDQFSEEWLKCRVKQYTGARRHELLEALSAYHEFDIEKLKVALNNPGFRPGNKSNQNDALDSQQLAYLCDPALHFVTCDKGYLRKIKKSSQTDRIHQASLDMLSDPVKAEELLKRIAG
jgi:hypothetical protein